MKLKRQPTLASLGSLGSLGYLVILALLLSSCASTPRKDFFHCIVGLRHYGEDLYDAAQICAVMFPEANMTIEPLPKSIYEE